tara:strand:+ start:833 stop:1216 length:384 start_codon:yes stop_codon:yes gene_type:complete
VEFYLEVISPEKVLISKQVSEVTVPAYEGDMTILAEHVNLVTFLRPGIMNEVSSSNQKRYFIEEGTVEFSRNKLLILTPSIIDVEKIDRSKISEQIKDLENKVLSQKNSDKQNFLYSQKIETLKNIT